MTPAKYLPEPNPRGQRISDPADRFWRHVAKTDGCWEWTGTSDGKGYGGFSVKVGHGWRQVKAHRFAYELLVGPIPEGLQLDHLCRNRACVNPTHLFIGTHADNMADMASKGRANRAPKNRRLSDEQVAEIRALVPTGVRTDVLARRYGVCVSTVRNAVSGRTFGAAA